jgi:predicted transcriptional regulator
MLVEEIMTKSVETITTETSLQDVASKMCLKRFSGLPVIDQNNQLLGMLAERDVLRYLFPDLKEIMHNLATVDFEAMEGDYKKVLPLKTEELMIRNVITVRPDMPILKAVSVMARHNFRRIPVADGNTLVGMLSLGDVHRAIFMKSYSASSASND